MSTVYTYNNWAGHPTSQRVYLSTLPAGWQGPGLDKTTNYSWDSEGKLTGEDNPAIPAPYGTRYQYFQFDNMGRPMGTTLLTRARTSGTRWRTRPMVRPES